MQEIDATELYTTRLLVFLETEPQSNIYNQVILDGETFANVSDAIVGMNDAGDGKIHEITISTKRYEMPDLQDIN